MSLYLSRFNFLERRRKRAREVVEKKIGERFRAIDRESRERISKRERRSERDEREVIVNDKKVYRSVLLIAEARSRWTRGHALGPKGQWEQDYVLVRRNGFSENLSMIIR